MQNPIAFYRSFFHADDVTHKFVEGCENSKITKIMLHQTIRLISLSDDIPVIRPEDETLQLLFLIMCAENIAKLHAGFQGIGQSRKYVEVFFESFLSAEDKNRLGEGFVFISENASPRENLKAIGFKKAVCLLYDIRCDVVHEGNYSSFAFHDGRMGFVNIDPDVIAEIRLVEIRDMIVRGSISAIQSKS